MKRMLGAALAILAGGFSAVAAVSTNADSYVQSTDLTLYHSLGYTVVHTGKIQLSNGAKLIKQNDGTAALANGENLITGGLEVRQGGFRIDSAGAIGDDTVPVNINGGTVNHGRIQFNCKGLTFRNPIEFVSGDDIAKQGAVTRDNTALAAWDDVTIDSTIAINGHGLSLGVISDAEPTMTVNSELDAGTSDIFVWNFGTTVLNGQITCRTLSLETSLNHRKYPVRFSNAANAIGEIKASNVKLSCGAANVLVGASFSCSTPYDNNLYLNGYDQTLRYLEYVGTAAIAADSGQVTIYSLASDQSGATKPAALTLTGGAAGEVKSANNALKSGVRLVIDFENPTFVQVLSNRIHATAEPLVIKSGVLRLGGAAVFSNLPELTIEEGGELDVRSTPEAQFPNLTNLTVNGTLRLAYGLRNVFNKDKTVLTLGPNAAVYVEENTTDARLNVKELLVDGQSLKGNFEYPAPCVPQLKSGKIGAGSASYGTTTWTGAGETDLYSDPDNWQEKSVPEAGRRGKKLVLAGGSSLAFTEPNTLFEASTITNATGADLDFEFRASAPGAKIGFFDKLKAFGAAENGARTSWRFSLPVSFMGWQDEWTVAAGDRVEFLDDVSSALGMKIVGGGSFTMVGATNTFNHYIVFEAATNLVSGVYRYYDGHIGGLETGSSSANIVRFSPACHNTISNAVIERSVYVSNAGSLDNTRTFNFPAGTTNLFKGTVWMGSPKQLWTCEPTSYVEFSGGMLLQDTYNLLGGGNLVFSGKPFTLGIPAKANKNRTFSVRNGSLTLAAPGSTFYHLQLGLDADFEGDSDPTWIQTVTFGCDHTVTNTPVRFASDCGNATLDLGGTVQDFMFLATYPNNLITGREGSLVNIAGGFYRGTGGDAVTNGSSTVNCRVEGAVGFQMGAGGTLRLDGSAIVSTGLLSATNGTVEVAAGTVWNGDVSVSGEGVVSFLHSRAVVPYQSALSIGGNGRLNLPAGTRQIFRTLTVDGTEMPSGRYSRTGAGGTQALDCLTGDGVLVVSARPFGSMIFVK